MGRKAKLKSQWKSEPKNTSRGKLDLEDEVNSLPPDHILDFTFDVDQALSMLCGYYLLISVIRCLSTLGCPKFRNIRSLPKGKRLYCFRVNLSARWHGKIHQCHLIFLKSNLYLVAWGSGGNNFEFEASPATFGYTIAKGLSMSYSGGDDFPLINGFNLIRAIITVSTYQVGMGKKADSEVSRYLEFFMWVIPEAARFERIFLRTATEFRPEPCQRVYHVNTFGIRVLSLQQAESDLWLYGSKARALEDIKLVNSWHTISKAIVSDDYAIISVKPKKLTEVKVKEIGIRHPIHAEALMGVLAYVKIDWSKFQYAGHSLSELWMSWEVTDPPSCCLGVKKS